LIPTSHGERTTRFLFACCVIQFAGCVYYWLIFMENGYLPSPFVYDKADTFMDLFNPMYWADEPGRYTDWGSVYPPLNFLFLKCVRWLLVGQIHESDAFTLRDSAKPLIPYIVAAFAASALFVFRHDLWRGYTGAQKILLFFLFLLSPPMLFSIERGNLIIFALGFLALALAKPGWTRTFAIGMLINIKPYFALYLVAFAISQRPKELISCTMMAGAIFLISGILLDEHFMEFVQNLFQFTQDQNLFSPRELLALPSSVSAFTQVLRIYLFSGGSPTLAGISIGLIITSAESIKWLAILATLLSLGLGGRRIPIEITLAATTIAITNLGVWVGGYSFILYVCLIPILYRLTYRKTYLACLFLIFMPIDVITLFSESLGNRYSYLSDATVSVNFQLSVGAFLRPVVNFGLLLTMSLDIFQNYAPLARELRTKFRGGVRRKLSLTGRLAPNN
jgi:Glycosyltransferase family 87